MLVQRLASVLGLGESRAVSGFGHRTRALELQFLGKPEGWAFRAPKATSLVGNKHRGQVSVELVVFGLKWHVLALCKSIRKELMQSRIKLLF